MLRRVLVHHPYCRKMRYRGSAPSLSKAFYSRSLTHSLSLALGLALGLARQVLTLTGVLVAVTAVCFFPTIIPKVGIVRWQRCGCILGIAISMAAPYAKRFSWNDSSLFFVSLATNFLFNCGVMMVSYVWFLTRNTIRYDSSESTRRSRVSLTI